MNNIQSPQQAALLAVIRRSGSWFYWIAGLSVFRAVMNLMSHQTSISFYSMGTTNMMSSTSFGFGIALVLCAICAGFGVLAGRGSKWPFIVGAVLYALDAVLLLLLAISGSGAFAYLAVAFHGYVIYQFFVGIKACNQLEGLQRQMAAGAPQGAWYGGGTPQQPGAWPPAPGQPQQPGQWPSTPDQPQAGGWPQQPTQPQAGGWPQQQPSTPQFGAPPAPQQPYPPTAPTPPAAGSPSPLSTDDWSTPAQPQALPSHWPAPVQPQPQPAPESES